MRSRRWILFAIGLALPLLGVLLLFVSEAKQPPRLPPQRSPWGPFKRRSRQFSFTAPDVTPPPVPDEQPDA